MRSPLASLAGRCFDVAVIGAGVNGASAAQHLAAAGYEVLLVDKADFASGSSGRSSRLLHCGLRYLAPGRSLWEFAVHPGRFVTACRMAKAAMECRAQFVKATPERTRPMTFCFPFYEDSPYKAWQIDAAFALLNRLGPSDVPLDYRRLSPRQALEVPLLRLLRNPESLRGVAQFREYQFDWPERIVMDTVLDAERLGATARNYTVMAGMKREGEAWQIQLADALAPDEPLVSVKASSVFNMAGIWIDKVNGRSGDGRARRRITGTKGVHIVVQLPPDCADYGVATLNRKREGFYCVPWRGGLHYFGPTETLYEGDVEDIRPTEEDVEFLLGEANHLLPSLQLTRADVRYSWAGVRPLTYDPVQPMGARSRELHDLSGDGLPGVFAMTAGPIMTHRSAGREAVARIRPQLPARRSAQAPSYAAVVPDESDSPPLTNSEPQLRLSAVRRAVEREQAETLVDILFRRTGAGWSEGMGRESAERVAQVLGDAKGWTLERVRREAAAYSEHLERQHLHGGASTPGGAPGTFGGQARR